MLVRVSLIVSIALVVGVVATAVFWRQMPNAVTTIASFGAFGLLLLPFAIIGILRRRKGLSRAQALAPGQLVFRFVPWTEYRAGAMQLAPTKATQIAQRFGSVGAGTGGLTIWQGKLPEAVLSIPWDSIAEIRGTVTILAGRSYPTVSVWILDQSENRVALPFISAMPGFVPPRSSDAGVDWIVARLNDLRLARSSATIL